MAQRDAISILTRDNLCDLPTTVIVSGSPDEEFSLKSPRILLTITFHNAPYVVSMYE